MKNSFHKFTAAATLGVALATTPIPSHAGKAIKLPPSVAQKIGSIFRSTPKNPTRQPGGVLLGADMGTRLSHALYASMSVAQIVALDEKGMDDMAYKYFLSERSKAEETGTLLDPQKDQNAFRVQQITRRIMQSIRENPQYRDRYTEIRDTISNGTGWKIVTIKSPTLNAFCLPGGRMVVYTGLAEKLTDDELAMVIGHEIMHAMKGHSYNTAKESLQRKAVLYAGAAALGGRSLPVTMAILGEAFSTATIFSRGHEKEADISGLHIARDARFSSDAALTLWKKMDQFQQGKTPPEFLSSHPSHTSREQYLKAEIARMKSPS